MPAAWQRVVIGRARGPDKRVKDPWGNDRVEGTDIETIDPTLWSMSASKDAVQQQLAASLPDGEGPFAKVKAFLADAIEKLDTPAAVMQVRVEEATNDPRASRLREIHITIRVLPAHL